MGKLRPKPDTQLFYNGGTMTHLIKLSEKGGGDALHRTYEQQICTLADIRELVSYLQVEVNKANREGRELFVELWTDYYDPSKAKPMVAMEVTL